MGKRVEFDSLHKVGVVFRGELVGHDKTRRYAFVMVDGEKKPRHVGIERIRACTDYRAGQGGHAA